MKKTIALSLAAILVLIAITVGYRAYRADAERAEAAIRAADAEALAAARRADADRRTTAEAVARRLADLQAAQEAEAAEQQQAELRAAEAARLAAEEAARRLAAERDRLERDQEAAAIEARRQGEIREKEFAEAEARRLDALNQVAELERRKRDVADRDAAHAAAVKRQLEIEAARLKEALLRRSPNPADLWWRQRFNTGVGIFDSQTKSPNSASNTVQMQ